nr:MAG TPA: hypothetical protein [Caudoviricetes sp.]
MVVSSWLGEYHDWALCCRDFSLSSLVKIV